MRLRFSPRLLKALAGAILAACLIVPSHQPAHASAAYSRWDSVAAIQRASRITGVSYWWLYRVANCESRLNPGAWNRYSGASGLFQFMPGTYYSYAARYRIYGSPWNPYTAALVAAWMFWHGQAYQWVCR